jgi:hypothetical protein
MSKERDQGPKSDLARYAYGYSDRKPGPAFWVIHAVMTVVALGAILGAWGR